MSFSVLIASLVPNIDISNFLLINKKKEIGSTDVDIDAYAELQFDNQISSCRCLLLMNLNQKNKNYWIYFL